jgi:hypothetical protein
VGYTHYWQCTGKQWENEQWDNLRRFVMTMMYISKETRVTLSLTDKDITINGLEGEGCEDFYLNKNNVGWHFCKTCRRHYDIFVTGTLLYLKYVGKNYIVDISSDGEMPGEEGYGQDVEWVNASLLFLVTCDALHIPTNTFINDFALPSKPRHFHVTL